MVPYSAVIFILAKFNRSLIYFRQCIFFRTVVNSTIRIKKKIKNGASIFVKAPFFMHDYFYQIYLP